MAANTIDPAIGASTWAFGNHRWTENIGSLTRNPAKVINQKNEDIDICNGNMNSDDKVIKLWLDDV